MQQFSTSLVLYLYTLKTREMYIFPWDKPGRVNTFPSNKCNN